MLVQGAQGTRQGDGGKAQRRGGQVGDRDVLLMDPRTPGLAILEAEQDAVTAGVDPQAGLEHRGELATRAGELVGPIERIGDLRPIKAHDAAEGDQLALSCRRIVRARGDGEGSVGGAVGGLVEVGVQVHQDGIEGGDRRDRCLLEYLPPLQLCQVHGACQRAGRRRIADAGEIRIVEQIAGTHEGGRPVHEIGNTTMHRRGGGRDRSSVRPGTDAGSDHLEKLRRRSGVQPLEGVPVQRRGLADAQLAALIGHEDDIEMGLAHPRDAIIGPGDGVPGRGGKRIALLANGRSQQDEDLAHVGEPHGLRALHVEPQRNGALQALLELLAELVRLCLRRGIAPEPERLDESHALVVVLQRLVCPDLRTGEQITNRSGAPLG